MVDLTLQNNKVDTIILMGDYFDEWYQDNHLTTAEMLGKWIEEKRKEYQVICLLGNHDVPYITGNLQHYSNRGVGVATELKRAMFEEFKIQLAYFSDGWLFTHAGHVNATKLLNEYFEILSDRPKTIQLLNKEEMQVGQARGGYHYIGGVLWCDYQEELLVHGNELYPKQVVGHTPVTSVSIQNLLPDDRPNESYIGVDTFSLYSSGKPIGDGSLLLIDDGEPRVISTAYKKSN